MSLVALNATNVIDAGQLRPLLAHLAFYVSFLLRRKRHVHMLFEFASSLTEYVHSLQNQTFWSGILGLLARDMETIDY